MQPFRYIRVQDAAAAIAELARGDGTRLLAGGTNLLDLMKSGVEAPSRLVDVNALPLAGVVALADGGVRIGALARNSDLANHPLILARYPLLSQALLAGASPQLRNMATVGGNLLQRTRCHYFVDPAFGQCNKRMPGSGCAALHGRNRMHAILGASEQCIATHPSDMCVALAALEASVRVQNERGERLIAIEDFHRLPGNTPERDTNLRPGELITAVELPPPRFGTRVHYLKIRDRASYAFALVSVAAAIEIIAGRVTDVRLVLGGVAHKPWRAHSAERLLVGQAHTPQALSAAAALAVADAQPQAENAFKVELARRAIVRAVQLAAGTA